MSLYQQSSLRLTRAISFVAVIFLCCFLHTPTPAEQQGGGDGQNDSNGFEIDHGSDPVFDIKKYLSDLESPNFMTRREAFLELWKAGPSVIDKLAESSSELPGQLQPKVRWLQLLSRLDGAQEGVSDSLESLELLRVNNFHTLTLLAEKGKWAELFTLWNFLNSTQQEELLRGTSSFQVLGLCSQAIQQGRKDVLPLLADCFMPPPQAIVNRYRWFEKGLVEAAPEQSLLANTAYFECLTLERQKEYEAAADLARKRGVYGLSELVLFRNFQWSSALEDIEASSKEPEPVTSPDQLSEVVKACLLARWCDDLELAQQLRQKVLDASEDVKLNDMYPTALFVIGAWDESLELLKEELDSSNFVLLYRLQGEKKALREFGLDPDDLTTIEELLTKLRIGFLRNVSDVGGYREFSLLSTVSGLLHRLGRHDIADDFDSLLIAKALLDAGSAGTGQQNFAALIRTWVRFSNEPLARRVVAENLTKEDYAASRLQWLAAITGDSVPRSDGFLMTLHGDLENDWERTVDAWVRLSRGTLPPDKNIEWFHRLAEKAMSASKQPEQRYATIFTILDFALLLADRDFVISIIEEHPYLISGAGSSNSKGLYSGSSTAMVLRFAEFLAQEGNYETAAKIMGRFEDAVGGAPQIGGLRLNWLKESGQVILFERQKELIDWMPLAYHVRHQYYVTQAMLRGLEKYGVEYGKKAIAQVEYLYEELHGIAFQIAEATEDSNPREALNYIRFAQMVLLSNGQLATISPTRSLLYQTLEMRCELRIAIANRSWDKADKLFRRLAVSQTSTDVAIDFVPLAAEAFGDEKSNQWYQFYLSRLLEHLEGWPEDTMFLNNTAWMMANLDRDLDAAQSYAEKAVELSGRYPIYVDTLAEVVFRQGDVQRALELSLECKSVDRTEDQFQNQITRFTRVLMEESSSTSE